MTEMMNRIKAGNVGLRKANRRSSEGGDLLAPKEENFDRYQLKNIGKAATLDARFRSNNNHTGEGDIFDNFRKGLKSTSQNHKHATADRRISEPAGPAPFNFKAGLKSVPSLRSVGVEGSAVDAMRKLNVSRFN